MQCYQLCWRREVEISWFAVLFLGIRRFIGEPVYSASKHAVQSFVHGLRRQLLQKGIRVGAVAPGMVLNELWGIHDEDEINRRAELGEGLRSTDVAEAVLFMLTRPSNVTIRDLVMLPRAQDL
jgi:ribitol 2-dehydrogenase